MFLCPHARTAPLEASVFCPAMPGSCAELVRPEWNSRRRSAPPVACGGIVCTAHGCQRHEAHLRMLP